MYIINIEIESYIIRGRLMMCFQRYSHKENDVRKSSKEGKEEVNDDADDLGWVLYPDYSQHVVPLRCSVKFKRFERTDRWRRYIHGIVSLRSPLFTKLSSDLEIQCDPVIYASLAVTFLALFLPCDYKTAALCYMRTYIIYSVNLDNLLK